MKFLSSLLAASLLALSGQAPAQAQSHRDLTPEEASAIAEEALIFGMAFVSNYRVFIDRLVQGDPLMQGAGFNEFAHNRDPFPPETQDTTQRDTLFTLGIIDLRREPIVISVPDVPDGENYMLQMGDTSTETLPYISSITTDNKAGDYLLVGPEYQGYLPTGPFDGIITTRGQFVIMLGRTVISNMSDLTVQHAIQDGMAMRPMSAFLGTTPPPEVPPVDFIKWDAEKASGIGRFDYLNMALAWHPPAISELPLMARFARLGVVPGAPFPSDELSPEVRAAVEDTIKAVDAELYREASSRGGRSGTWQWDTTDISRFGTDYKTRSATAFKNIYPNAPDHAVYGQTEVDANGVKLTGAAGATVRFEADAFPPARMFWSMTVYDSATTAMFPNPAEIYNISSKNNSLAYADDGSLTMHIQAAEPTDPAERANWLPAPEGDFYVVLRLYGAQPEVMDGRWTPPPILSKAE